MNLATVENGLKWREEGCNPVSDYKVGEEENGLRKLK